MENQTSQDRHFQGKDPLHSEPRRIAVVGGGLAGMSAAFRLQELSRERDVPLEVHLFEASDRLGGIVGTERVNDYLVDIGADSFLTNKPGAVELCRRLNIEDRLIPTDSRYRGALVLFKGRPVPVPDGFQLLSPTAIWPMMSTPLLTWKGKLRLLMEMFIRPRGRDGELAYSADESVADFVRRRFGNEALVRLIQPLVGGIYTSDPEKLSMAATMLRFLEMERQHGSLIRASLFKTAGRNSAEDNDRPDSSSGARYGLFAGLKGGIEDLSQALRYQVESSCQIHLNCPVNSITRTMPFDRNRDSESVGGPYAVRTSDNRDATFHSVIVATSTLQASQLLGELDSTLRQELGSIQYASSALVVTGHRLSDISNPLHSFGLVIPHIENRKILAVSFSSRKFPERAPADRVLLRTFVGGSLQPELFRLSDTEMIATVQSELFQTLGVRGDPEFAKVYRYPNAMPQYHVGHLDRISRIEKHIARFPGIALAGIGYRGVGIPDVITSGERAAELIA